MGGDCHCRCGSTLGWPSSVLRPPKGATTNSLRDDLGKPAFDLIQPRWARRCEVNVIAGRENLCFIFASVRSKKNKQLETGCSGVAGQETPSTRCSVLTVLCRSSKLSVHADVFHYSHVIPSGNIGQAVQGFNGKVGVGSIVQCLTYRHAEAVKASNPTLPFTINANNLRPPGPLSGT